MTDDTHIQEQEAPDDAMQAATGSAEPEAMQGEGSNEPDYLKERLGRQQKQHQKQIRALQSQIQQMQSGQSSPQPAMGGAMNAAPSINPMTGQPIAPGSLEDHIHQAVAAGLRAKDMEEQRVKNQQAAQHVQGQYDKLSKDLDSGSDKYDDFDDVVRDSNAPFTPAMRDAALLLPNSIDVLYTLGKNRDELNRIGGLHSLDQAKEMVKLSQALALGGGKKNMPQSPNPLGNVKSNPMTGSNKTDEKTPIGELRKRLKAGWK